MIVTTPKGAKHFHNIFLDPDNKIRQAKILIRINCAVLKSRQLEFIGMDENGYIIDSNYKNKKTTEWDYIVPETSGAKLINELCYVKKGKKKYNHE